MAKGGLVLAIGNHLLSVAAPKFATTGSWPAYETREGPLVLSRLPQERYVGL